MDREDLHRELDMLRSRVTELEESERKHRSLFNSASETICVTQDGYIRYFNPAGAKLTGYSVEDLLTKPFAALTHPDDVAELARIYLQRLRGEDVEPGHRFRLINSAGEVRWVESWSASIEWEGRPAVLSMIRDVTKHVDTENLLLETRNTLEMRVTERTAQLQEINSRLMQEVRNRDRAERQARESETRLRKIMENSPLGIAVTDLRGQVEYLNKKFIELFGYSLNEIPTLDHWWRLAYPDPHVADHVRSEWLTAVRDSCEKGIEAPPVEREIQCKDGKTRIIDFRKTVIGQQVIHSFLDVTETRRQEQTLIESEQMFRLLSEQSLMSVAILQDGVYKYANQAMSDLCEYSLEEISKWGSEEFLAVIHSEDRSLVMTQSRMKQQGDVRQKTHYEFRIITKTGMTKWVAIYSKTIQFKGNPANLLTMLDVTERKKAAAALRSSEERLRLGWETSPDALSISRVADGTYVEVNGGYTFLTGYERDEVIGRSALDIPFWADSRDRDPFVETLEKDGHVKNFETRLRRKDGEERTILISAGIMKLEGEPHLLAVTKDIEDLKRAELALRESEQKYRLLAENASDVIWTVDLDLKVQYVSPSVEKMNGWTVNEWMSFQPSDYLPPASMELVTKVFHEELEIQQNRGANPNRVRTLELEQYRKDGSTFWTEVSARFLYDETQSPAGIIGATRDITERRRSQEQLQMLFAAIQQAGEAIMITEPDGTILYANPAFEKTTGYPLDQVMGRTAVILQSGKHNRDFYADMWSTIKRGEVWRGRFTNKKKDETLYEETATISPIKDGSGQVVYFVMVGRDITSEVMLQKQLNQAQKMEAIGTLAGGIAHDFNNLLQAILGYSDILLLKKAPGDPDRKKLEVIHQAARDGADLVARILTFSRKAESKARPVDLNEEIRKAEKLLGRTVPRMIEIKLVLTEDLRIIDADPAQIEQILLNLAVNAQHAMPDGGQLLIETSNVSLNDQYLLSHLGAKPGHYVVLAVSDTGVGIRTDMLDRIFEPFFTTKTNGEGTGLGLSMVHGIVSQHGGYIKCYSEPGRGTTFKIYFPVSSGELAPDLTLTMEMPAFGTETILLVDDDSRIREMGKQMIEIGGYTVLIATSGEEALDIYSSHKEEIALIILDLIMPGMGGKRCLEELLRIDPDVKVLVASGYSANGLSHDVKEGGAKGFVSKPYDAKEILIAIRSLLDKRPL